MAQIVVGVDHTAGSERALRWAVAEAVRTRSVLSTVHVWHLPLTLEVPLSTATAGAFQTSLERSGVGQLAELPETTAWAVEGDPGPVLVERAQHADLLVVGGRREGAFFHGGRPRVTSYCLRHSTVPVVVVPGHGPGPAIDSGRSRVVVGVDSSPGSHRALLWAARTAQQRDATLVAVHVWQLSPKSPADVVHPRRALPVQAARARERLRTWVGEVLGDDPEVPVELTVLHGSPLDHFFEQAATADLVVLGTDGHHAVRRLLTGSVSEQLAPLCPCPIVVVPP